MRKLLPHATRRRTTVAAAFTIALVAAGAALAGNGMFSASSTAVSATFYANTAVNTNTQTCTASNGDPIDITDSTFTGVATSSTASLNGPLTVSVRTVYDTKTAVGSLTGELTIGAPSSPPGFRGRVEAIDANGTVQGLVEGNAGPGAELLGNLTATYSANGFNSSTSQGSIGSGTGTDTAILTGVGCAPPQPVPPPKPVKPFPHPLPPIGNKGGNQNGGRHHGQLNKGRHGDNH
jgi:hypothetical protein